MERGISTRSARRPHLRMCGPRTWLAIYLSLRVPCFAWLCGYDADFGDGGRDGMTCGSGVTRRLDEGGDGDE